MMINLKDSIFIYNDILYLLRFLCYKNINYRFILNLKILYTRLLTIVTPIIYD